MREPPKGCRGERAFFCGAGEAYAIRAASRVGTRFGSPVEFVYVFACDLPFGTGLGRASRGRSAESDAQLQRVPNRARHRVEPPAAGDALELAFASVVKVETRTRDEVLHRA